MYQCLRSLLALSLLATFAVTVKAQSSVDGAIRVTVSNPNNEVITGADVVVRNTQTNKEVIGRTDDTGGFRAVQLEPGTYSVDVNSPGFASFNSNQVVVEVGRVTTLDAVLNIGPVQGTVEVAAEAPVINTTQQDFSENINQTTIDNVPTNGRRWSNLVMLTPGTSPDGNFGLVSFRGISGLLNNNTVDGGDNNGDVYTNAVLVRTAYNKRRVRLSVGIGYQDSIERARSIIRDVLQRTEGVLHEPAPSVYVAELAPSSVNFNVFFWTNSRQVNVLGIIDSATTAIKLALDEAGIDIPYPHTVVLNQAPKTPQDGASPENYQA